jgi:hypothetical protein
MRDRQKIETLLVRRFPGSTSGQIAAAANAIMALDDSAEKPFRRGHAELDEFPDASNGTCDDAAEEAVPRKATQDRRS